MAPPPPSPYHPKTTLLAVEAHYLHLFSSQAQPQLHRNSYRETMNINENPNSTYSDNQIFNTINPEMSSRFMANNNKNNNNLKKRSRDTLYFLGEDVSSQVYNDMLDMDRLILQHVANTRLQLSEKNKQFSNQIIVTINEIISKCLKSKDEEMDLLRTQNFAFEERIKFLANENSVWRYLAQAHETAAIALRANLEQVQAKAKAEQTADDAESCCCGDNYTTLPTKTRRKLCMNCGDGEPLVVLLPCQHLCLCAGCGSGIETCPICCCRKTGSIHVNLS